MRRNLRWATAGLVTAVVFAVPTWLCGAVFLPSVVTDAAVRWGLSSALGVVLATLAVAWGQSFATRAHPEDAPPPPSDGPVTASGPRSVAVKGSPTGNISTGDTGVRSAPDSSPARPEPQAPAPPAPQPEPGPGSVAASGERSIAINGNPGGTISTGDQLGEDPA
ncbi:hypothetical protein [Streptomyces stelliscabiei]|uniref:hypothetical protein n=1 Tax=Streptomyces stelliscabiei TaxID=146820 RepID=UPI0029B8CED1|nr:hypothetical protein [Streptomyces stelliscabiei]MDX2515895.1 hypothetical protein [Streptomyces stelliscabiei]MDX2549475.1 hypothetical protein [Streptomyces stelliscabiei]MDX2611497.1 hypothetical protein [Streptomyces stelliscabiei]MDX2634407.1 hypothetical protein [Streptomyces stelliscabiei]MDX2659353.1 hypothetical protein [Streptomyces stelliscabiei]